MSSGASRLASLPSATRSLSPLYSDCGAALHLGFLQALVRRVDAGNRMRKRILRMTVAMLVFGGVLAAGVGNALGADEPTLYERMGQGRLVVHGRCLLSGRRATIEVLSVLKGHYDSPRLTVSYRSDNYNRTAGSAKIEFEPGAESVLILEPELD